MAKDYLGGFPSNSVLEKAVIEALKNLGGEADVQKINQEVIDILQLPEEIVMLEDENDMGTKLSYRLRWTRTNLKAKGKIKSEKKGTWQLVD